MKRLLMLLITVLFGSCNENENLTTRLIGNWKWTSTCVGGVAGTSCSYADETTTRRLKFTNNRMIEIFDDTGITTKSYFVTTKTNFDDYTEYQIRFNDETTCVIRATKNTLEIGYITSWNSYRK